MVVIRNKPFPSEDKSYDNLFPSITLSDFQKWAIKGLSEGNDVLITAHTGSGKTLPCDYLITKPRTKRLIYTSPIKSLSNQKLYEFRRKYPFISFGLLTGDIKDNPQADVLIMTTEILRNTLFIKGQQHGEKREHYHTPSTPNNEGRSVISAFGASRSVSTTTPPPRLLFEMDFETELHAVIFDEVHYINDAERGSVWEQSIMLLPKHVQILMLSATINHPEHFAEWVETRGVPCHLIPTTNRVVPLTHYLWISTHLSTHKSFKSTPYEYKLQQLANKPVVIKQSDETFIEENYHKVYDLLHYMRHHNIFVKRSFVLNELVRYLKANEMLPAICFVFSRKQVEQCAKEISINLYDDDSKQSAVVAAECKRILMSKLPNYREYMNLPEYTEMIALLEKGIAIHHAGIMTVLREMIELLFEKGYIKLLFATETFAVGINMPTKTAIFTGLTKFNGKEHRNLYPHEYTQMAGRAGRRGLDKIGHVIHCNNLFELDSAAQYRNMLCGPSQTITSKFKISFGLILSILSRGGNVYSFVEQTMLKRDIMNEMIEYEKKGKEIDARIAEKEKELSLHTDTPRNILEEYKQLTLNIFETANSARKKLRREMAVFEEKYNRIEEEVAYLLDLDAIIKERDDNEYMKQQTTGFIRQTVDITMNVLVENGFAEIGFADKSHKLTTLGHIASHFQEVHPLMMGKLLIETNYLSDLSAPEIVGLLSCFTNCIAVPEELQIFTPETDYDETNRITKKAEEILMSFSDAEAKYEIYTGETYEMIYDIQNAVIRWCEAEDEKDCKIIIQDLKEKEVFLGDFIKALLKINNMASEMENMCETIGHAELLEKVKQIPALTLKYVATNQSLYI
jgi:superfamily II RNA helicase